MARSAHEAMLLLINHFERCILAIPQTKFLTSLLVQRTRQHPITLPATQSGAADSPRWLFIFQNPLVLQGNRLINSPLSAFKLVSGREEVSGKEGGIAGRDLYQGALLQ